MVVNSTDSDRDFRRDDMMGFAEPVDHSRVEEHKNVEAQVAGIASQFENEPAEPGRGPSHTSLSPEDKEALLEKLVIRDPPKFFEKCKNLLLDYHDVCS